MILVADADVRDPIVQALQAIRFPIYRLSELRIPVRPDAAVMQGVLDAGGLLLTFDAGVPSQAYLHQFGQAGLTVAVVRLNREGPVAWQKVTEIVLRDWHTWQRVAAQTPSVISVTWSGSRWRAWEGLPSTMASQASPQA